MNMRRLVAAGAWAPLVLILGGCAPEAPPAETTDDPFAVAAAVWLDPHVAAVDQGAPNQQFDGGGGSLVPTTGWGLPEVRTAEGGTEAAAWGLGDEAVLLFRRPPSLRVDFFAVCSPFSYPGAPRQTVQLVLNGVPAKKTLVLQPGLQEVRARLPTNALRPGLNELRLLWGYARSPRETGGGEDARRLAVRFTAMAVLPAAVEEPIRYLAAARLVPEGRRIELPELGSYAVPLPTGIGSRLSLGKVERRCRDCRLNIEARLPDGKSKVLWEGDPQGASGLALDVPPARELSFQVTLPEGAAAAAAGVTIELPDRLLSGTAEAPRRQRRPDVLFYVVDTLRDDAVRPEVAPQLEQFADDAVRFTRAWTPSSWTLPATASLLTGVYPARHGVMKGDRKLPPDHLTLASALGDRGYDTVGISQSFVAGPAFGLDAGFGEFLLADQLNGFETRSQEARRILVTWLLDRPSPERPFFAYLHTVDPHAPYLSPAAADRLGEPGAHLEYRPQSFLHNGWQGDPDRLRRLRGLYEEEVRHADEQFGRFVALLRYLGLYRDALIVFTSDHGEEFAEHGGFDHGRTVFEEMLRVPLLVKLPGQQRAGESSSTPVSTLDTFATALEVAGGDAGRLGTDSRGLPPTSGVERGWPLFAEVSPVASAELAAVDYRAFALGSVKCIESRMGTDQFGRPVPPLQVYDLERDSQERSPLDSTGAAARGCLDALRSWTSEGRSGESPGVDDEARRQLRSLGYVE
jgi:arylsulfatase A-like enzyme